jgi:hypothetical protein
VGKSDRKGPLGRPRCKWGVNINIDIKEIGWDSVTGFIWLGMGKTDDIL